MASSLRAGRMANNKENRPLPGKQINTKEADLEKSATPKRTPRAPAARQATPNRSTVSAARSTVSATARVAASNRGMPLPKQVEMAAAQLKDLEAQLEAMQAEADDAEAEALDAERAMNDGAEELTTRTAEMLAEYAAKSSAIAALEAEAAEVNSNLEAQRVKNLELAARNIELDREARVRQQALDEARSELERVSKSQDELDAELERHAQNCERLKLEAQLQAERCAVDWRRLDAMSKRLSKVAGDTASDDVQQLLVEAAKRMSKVKEAQTFLENLHREGPQPEPTTWEAAE